jgi:hypothetical protein
MFPASGSFGKLKVREMWRKARCEVCAMRLSHTATFGIELHVSFRNQPCPITAMHKQLLQRVICAVSCGPRRRLLTPNDRPRPRSAGAAESGHTRPISATENSAMLFPCVPRSDRLPEHHSGIRDATAQVRRWAGERGGLAALGAGATGGSAGDR